MPRPRKIEEAPLPNWPILMSTALAARYLSMDENSFVQVTRRAGVRPVDLGLAMVRWRRGELDRLVNDLPATSGLSGALDPVPDAERAATIAKRVVDELASRASALTPLSYHSPPREALGIKEAAAAIGVSRSTIYRLINDRALPTKKIAGRVLLRRSDLEALLRGPGPDHTNHDTVG